jgi:hypothetical protein
MDRVHAGWVAAGKGEPPQPLQGKAWLEGYDLYWSRTVQAKLGNPITKPSPSRETANLALKDFPAFPDER